MSRRHSYGTELKLFTKATLSAILATVCDWGVSGLLAYLTPVADAVATASGAISGGVLNCAVNYRWVFRDCGCPKYRVVLKYMLVWLLSIALNTGGTALLGNWCGTYMTARIATSLIVAVIWNYPMQRFYVYRVFPHK